VQKSAQNKIAPGVRQPYFRVFGIELDVDGSGRSGKVQFSPEEEEKFQNLSRQPDCYERIARSIAPSIFGSEDIKKSIACLLFGGTDLFHLIECPCLLPLVFAVYILII
jgi:DNA replication licensing factor MCM5